MKKCKSCRKSSPVVSVYYCMDCDTIYFKKPIQVKSKYNITGEDASLVTGQTYTAIGIERYKNRKHYIIKYPTGEILWGVSDFE